MMALMWFGAGVVVGVLGCYLAAVYYFSRSQ